MAIYEFVCEDCNKVFESKLSEVDVCPFCTGKNTRRKFSTFTFKFGGHPKWVDKIDDRQKAQEERGESPTIPHPKEVI